jgi:hypothetical protein
MSITDNETLSYILERDVDLVLLQLIKTSPEFRDWFVDQLEEEIEIQQYLGARHSVERESGESDVEMGIETQNGESHIILIENKIDASLQERQAERYFERGESYVRNEGWDNYSVVLVAPANYVGDGVRLKFGNTVLYEELVNQIETIDHDGSSFFKAVFDKATSKRASRIDSYWTDEVERRIESKFDELPPVGICRKSNKHLRVESTQPEHPHHVLYNAFFPSEFDGEKAVIRLNLTGRQSGSISIGSFESLRPILLSQQEHLKKFEFPDRRMDPVKTVLWRSDFNSDDEYLSEVTDTLVKLITVYHPILVQHQTTVTIERDGGKAKEFNVYDVEELLISAENRRSGDRETEYWVLYGLDLSSSDIDSEMFIQLTVPETFTSQAMGSLQVILIPKEGEFSVIY